MFDLENPSRKKTVKILTVGNYSVMVIDIIRGLAFVPLYLHYLGDRLYGLWLGTGGIIAVLAFLDMGIATLVIQRISREYGKKNFDGISTYFFSGLLLNAFFMSILLIAGFVLSNYLGSFFKQMTPEETEVLAVAFQVALVALILGIMNNLIEGTLNALQKPLFGKIAQIIAATLGLITTYILLVARETVIAIPAGMMVRSVASLLPNLVYLFLVFSKNHIQMFTLRWVTMKDYLLLTPNLLLSKVGTSLVGNIEPTLINMFLTPEIAVYFSVTKTAGGLIKTVLDRVGGILFPSISHLYANDDKGEKFKEFILQLVKNIIPFSVAIFLLYFLMNSLFINVWVGSANYLGDAITGLIAISLLFSFYSNLMSYLLGTTGDIGYPSILIFFESIVKLILLYLLLKVFGIIGLPIAVLVSSLIFIILYGSRWDKLLKMNRNEKIQIASLMIKNIKWHLLITLITILCIKYFNLNTTSQQISIYSFVVICFGLILVYQNNGAKQFILARTKWKSDNLK